jgi:hypothetical protein
MGKTVDKLIHEIDQDFTSWAQEKAPNLVERITAPSSWINEDQRKRASDERLNLINGIFKPSAVSLDLEFLIRLMERSYRFLKTRENARIAF